VVLRVAAHVSLLIAVIAIAIAGAVAFFRDAVMSAISTVGVAWLRIRHYDQLFEYAKGQETVVESERIHIENLVQILVSHGLEPSLTILEARLGNERRHS
jgi:hypothetical protein